MWDLVRSRCKVCGAILGVCSWPLLVLGSPALFDYLRNWASGISDGIGFSMVAYTTIDWDGYDLISRRLHSRVQYWYAISVSG